MGVRINLIGSISLTEIYVLLQTPILIKWVVNSSLPYLKTLCVLFLALILAQGLSELYGSKFICECSKRHCYNHNGFVAFFILPKNLAPRHFAN